MYDGKHVLIVFDDLTKQAEAYRAVSLLLRRPPGREAYPGDVFYLHSRLLERCAKLSDDLGHGSMTGLPIVETKANDVSAFIPTNVISITDGQIFLQSDLFAANQRPAIDVGVSVSRVGGAAMTKAMKAVTGSLKVDLAQFRAMEAFAMFASDLDAASRQQLDRGQRLMALLKQPQYSPYPVEEMTVSLWTGTTGRLDAVPTEDILRFESEFLDYLRRGHEGILAGIRESGKFDDDTESELDVGVRQVHRPVRDLRRARASRPARRSTRRSPTTSSSRSRSSSRSGADLGSSPSNPDGGEADGASLREYRARIRSVQSTKKITRAMELIAASRVVKAQQRVQASSPYARALTRAVSAVATYSNVDHPLTTERGQQAGRGAHRHLRPRSRRGLLLGPQGERAPHRGAARRGQGGRPLPRRPQGGGLLQVPQARRRRRVERLHRPADLRGGPGDRRARRPGLHQGLRRGRRSTRSTSSSPGS